MLYSSDLSEEISFALSSSDVRPQLFVVSKDKNDIDTTAFFYSIFFFHSRQKSVFDFDIKTKYCWTSVDFTYLSIDR